MPVAKPPLSPQPPAPLRQGEADYIVQTVRQYYGQNAVIRNYGPHQRRLELHVETDIEPGLERYECMGLLGCEIDRDAIDLEVTKRGRRVRGNAKIAYRQGQIV